MCMCDDMTDVLYMKTHIVVVWTCFLYVMQIAKYLSNYLYISAYNHKICLFFDKGALSILQQFM